MTPQPFFLCCFRSLVRFRAFVSIAGAMAAISMSAQVSVSNLDEAFTWAEELNSTDWVANAFTTDATNSSYELVSVTLTIAGADNNSGNFFVALFSDDSGQPDSSMQILSGEANPETGGDYTYTPSSTVTLLPSTTYHLVTGVSSGAGAYRWGYTNSSSETNSGGITWTIADLGSESSDSGSSWVTSVAAVQMFSVTVSPVPEPQTYAVWLGVISLGWVVLRRRR